jgi:5-methylcytosine-specific restriction endonuclease McrA
MKTDEWATLQKIMENQGNVCPYFGVPIQVGINAELDHKTPRARGGTNDLANLQWVHTWANKMKLDMTEEEFLAELDRLLPFIVAKRQKSRQKVRRMAPTLI